MYRFIKVDVIFVVMSLKRLLPLSLLAISALTLAACSSGEAVAATTPTSCEQPAVVAAFSAQVEGAKFVPTDWQPSEGTDLEAAINAGGIACTYGIQVAEVGGTVLWAPNTDNVWDSRVEGWKQAGQTRIDIPGIDESAAYILQEGTSADEMHVWTINMLVDGVWIQLGATFLQTLDEAIPILESLISVTRA